MAALYRLRRQRSAPLSSTAINFNVPSLHTKTKARQPMRIRPKEFVGLSLSLLVATLWLGIKIMITSHGEGQQIEQIPLQSPQVFPASSALQRKIPNDEHSPPLLGKKDSHQDRQAHPIDTRTRTDTTALGAEQPFTPQHQQHDEKVVLTFYLEPISTTMNQNDDNSIKPLPRRRTSASNLHMKTFPEATCDGRSTLLQHFPVDDFPRDDPYLPWIHDYFVRVINKDDDDDNDIDKNDIDSPNLLEVQFVAQNKRRCETGEGKEIVMKYWEPQMALFQPVPVEQFIQKDDIQNKTAADNTQNSTGYQYRLTSPDHATAKETRFLCRFHSDKEQQQQQHQEEITFSTFNIPYEFVNWRKHKGKPMFRRSGSDVHQFEFSQLLFSCPVPERFRSALLASKGSTDVDNDNVWLDLIPIRTPARHGQWLLTPDHVGPDAWEELPYFNTTLEYGTNHILPAWQDSGRIANLPLCPIVSTRTKQESISDAASVTVLDGNTRQHRLVVCTWTAFSYRRRGDSTIIQDAAKRLQEWIVFHKLAGVDHIYIYDNTQTTEDNPEDELSPLLDIAARFPDYVTYISWPYQVCSNNRPNHKNPGERSSQYAAEASCRERFGPTTEWMSFIDTDEYLVPMRPNSTWTEILEDYAKQHPDIHVLKFRSSRGRPREQLLQVMEDQNACKPQSRRKPRHPLDPCLTQRSNETFLRTYNCDYIKPPKPDRFARAMKQIYRPSFVLSHFVHYSTITTAIVKYYQEFVLENETHKFTRQVRDGEWGDAFFDEVHWGALIHTKTVLPYETMTRTTACQTGSKQVCAVGYVCPKSTLFNDTIHTKNLFVDENNKFCNCWVNPHVEEYWVTRLEQALKALE